MTLSSRDVAALRSRISGTVLAAGDDAFAEEHARGFNTAVRSRPDLIVAAREAADVREAVAFAAAHGLPVGVRSTGHGPAGGGDGGVLVVTRAMADVTVDPAARLARIGAGARWEQVTPAAAAYGLAPLSGSAPHTGAVGYLLGGGLPLLGRTFGYAADRVRALEVVTAGAELVRVTAGSDPELFWALRGGRDNFGLVTAVETELLPLTTLWGGGLYYRNGTPGQALATARAWAEWTEGLPEEMNSSLAFVALPDVPALPEPLRGQYVAHVRIAYAGQRPEEGERLVARLRARTGAPVLESLAVLPVTQAGSVHNDPARPMAWNSDIALLSALDETALRGLLAAAGPAADEPAVLELRHLGGALARPGAAPSAVGHRDARYSLGVLTRMTGGESEAEREAVVRRQDALLAPFAPWTAGRFVNFMGHGPAAAPDRVRTAYDPGDYERLTALKARRDPAGLFRLGHRITG